MNNKLHLSSVSDKITVSSLAKVTSFFLIILIFVSSCASFGVSEIPDNISDNVQQLVERGEKHWGKRVRFKDARLAHVMLKQAVSLAPHDQNAVALFARICHFLGYYVEEDPAMKDALFQEGADATWTWITSSKNYMTVFDSTQGDSIVKSFAGLSALPENSVPVMYWYCANKGRFLANKKVIERLQYRETLEVLMHKIIASNSDYFFGGPNRFFGAFYARLPGVDLSFATDYFNKSIATEPNYFETYLLRARYLHTKSGDRESFEKDLQFVIDADPALLPDAMPENLLSQERAEELLTHTNMLFE